MPGVLGALRLSCLAAPLFALPASAVLASAQATPQKNVQRYELGRVDRTAGLDLTVPFKNSTGSTVVIDTVQSSCACLRAEFEPESIGPGEMGYLNVSIDLTNKRGDFLEEAVLYTDRLDNSRIVFYFSGYALSDVEVEPQRVFIRVSEEPIEPIKVRLEGTKAPLKYARVLDLPEWLTHSARPMTIVPEWKAGDVEETTIDDMPAIIVYTEEYVKENTRNFIEFDFAFIKENLPKVKHGRETLLFGTDPASADPVAAVLEWERETMYVCSPPSIVMTRNGDGSIGPFGFSVKRIDDEPFGIEGVFIEGGAEGLDANYVKKARGGAWEIEVSFTGGDALDTETGSGLGVLVIETDAEDDPTVELPISMRGL